MLPHKKDGPPPGSLGMQIECPLVFADTPPPTTCTHIDATCGHARPKLTHLPLEIDGIIFLTSLCVNSLLLFSPLLFSSAIVSSLPLSTFCFTAHVLLLACYNPFLSSFTLPPIVTSSLFFTSLLNQYTNDPSCVLCYFECQMSFGSSLAARLVSVYAAL